MSANLRAFLYLIRYCEGTSGENGYRTLFGGGLFDSFADHPRQKITRTLGGKPITSSAAGAYQFLTRTWDECARALGLTDFSPESQDRAAVFLIKRRGALPAVEAGNLDEAIRLCNKEWASLPGSPYGQPVKTLAECRAVYHRAGGMFVPAQPVEVVPMAPFIAAAIPALVEMAPSLIRIFGKGAQSEKNAQAAEKVVELAKAVTGEETVEGAVNKITANPDSREAFRQEIKDHWYDLIEVGEGGIGAAREYNLKASDTPLWKQPAVIVTFALLPLVYYTAVMVLQFGEFTSETKAMVVAAIITGVLGGITGFFLGSSIGSKEKNALLSRDRT